MRQHREAKYFAQRGGMGPQTQRTELTRFFTSILSARLNSSSGPSTSADASEASFGSLIYKRFALSITAQISQLVSGLGLATRRVNRCQITAKRASEPASRHLASLAVWCHRAELHANGMPTRAIRGRNSCGLTELEANRNGNHG
jgi:hypothetical protein